MPKSVGQQVVAPTPVAKEGYLNWRRFFQRDCLNFWLFVAVHVYALVGLLFVPWTWRLVGLCVASYYIRMFGITGGYHRYFSHRSYHLPRVPQFLLAWLGASTMQKGVLWWASHHRHHHKYSDQEEDVHSPTLRGFLWSHCGWFLLSNDYVNIRWEYIPDLAHVPELLWLEKNHLLPGMTFAVTLFLVGGYPAFFWGFIVSTVLLWHGTYTINSLSHVYGSRRYNTTDTSRNNFYLALITLGEGWHNNHHAYMSATANGFFWYEIDPTYYVVKAMSALGVASRLRQPAWDLLEKKLISKQPPQDKRPEMVKAQ